jgi:dolichol-phosphate mannosyltransferase
VVVPCYNEAAVVRELWNRVTKVVRDLFDNSYEIILVNDGSRDNSWQVMSELVQADSHVVAVDLARNHGHQLALTSGLSLAKGNLILIIDADLQDPPELLPDMLRLLNEGADVVYGQRVAREGETVFKKVTANVFYRLLHRLSDTTIPMDTGDFRLMRRNVLEVLLKMPEQYRFIRGMVAWIGFRQVPLPYTRPARFAGETQYPLRKMVTFALDALMGFSMAPLRLSLILAVSCLFLAFLIAIYTIVSWVAFNAVPGWASLLLTMLIFSCAQLFGLAIIGEYVGRTYMQTKNRPLFIIREVATRPEGHRRA